jgi:hypothetical protein
VQVAGYVARVVVLSVSVRTRHRLAVPSMEVRLPL